MEEQVDTQHNCVWICALDGLHVSTEQEQVTIVLAWQREAQVGGSIQNACQNVQISCGIIGMEGKTPRMAAVGCCQYCWVCLQWYRDDALISANKTADLFITKIGACLCWFLWWQQLFALYAYFFYSFDQQVIKICPVQLLLGWLENDPL